MEPSSSPAADNMSKTDRLRGIITDKLTAAALEILAAVAVTVADYEQEAAGFRQEIDRQRRQLELLLPSIKAEPSDDRWQCSVCEARGRGVAMKEEPHRYEISVENIRSSGNLGFRKPSEEEVRNDDEENQRKHLAEQDCGTSSRFSPPAVQTDAVNVGRPPVRDLEDLINLRICILRDWDIEVLSRAVFQKYPFHELPCPCGLQEAEFLNLLRSTLPPLASGTPFGFFITDRSKRLYPLKVESFTPEQVIKAAGNSALYIRPKRPVELQAGPNEPLQDFEKNGEDAPTVPAAPGTRNETNWKPPQNWMSLQDNQVNLKIRILEDSDVDVISPQVLRRSRCCELQCPCGLQEADFLNLLRSTFPLLATDRPFEPFIMNRTKKLHPLNVQSFTPEQVCRAAGHSALYLRLKPPVELRTGQNSDDDDDDESSRSSPRLTAPSKDEPQQLEEDSDRVSDEDAHMILNICFLGHPQVDAVSPHVLKKYPPLELKCPPGLKEKDFLDLLKSTFPQLADDQPFTVLADEDGKLNPLKVERVTPEEISRTKRSTRSPLIYIQLKELPHKESTSHPSSPNTSPRVQADGPQSPEPTTQVGLKICILEDPNIDQITPSVFQKQSVLDLQCPANMQGAEFLDLLRSNFPLLDGKAFDFLACHGTKLRYLNIENPTPEKMKFIIRSLTGTVLYIRLKEQPETRDDVKQAQSDVSDQTKPSSRKQVQQRKKTAKVPSGKSRSHHRDVETEDSEDSNDVVSATPPTPQPQPDQCPEMVDEQHGDPSGLKTNSQLDEDETEDSEDGDDDQPKPSRLRFMPSLTSLPNTNLNCSAGPKKMEEPRVQHSEVDTIRQSEDEETEDSEDGEDQKSAISTKLMKQKVKPSGVTSDRQVENTTDDSYHPNTKQHKNTKRVERMEEHRATPSSGNPTNQSENQPRSNHTRKPERMLERVQQSGVSPNGQTPQPPKTQTGVPQLESCKVCSSSFGSVRKLIKHAWSHVNDRAVLCGVCGERSEVADELRPHLQTHQKTHTCDICGKFFLTKSGFRGHMNRHKGNKPHTCKTCNKGFTEKSVLNKHMLIHQHNKEHKCNTCPRSFPSDITLKLHLLTHSDRKQQEKPAQNPAELSLGRTPPKEIRISCEICKKSFFTEKCLQVHMMKHNETPNA